MITPKQEYTAFETEVQEYLALKSGNTRRTYSASFSKFLKFYEKNYGENKGLGHFLDCIFEEFKKPAREQKRVAETVMTKFIDDLKDQGLSNNSIRLYFAAVQNFLKYKHITVSMSFIGNMPPPIERKLNGKHEWKIEQIKQFVDAASFYRDKAIILMMLQSGLAVNEVSELNYGDVKDELEAGILPVCMKLVRQKTQVTFKTFIGYDAVKYLRLYLATRGKLSAADPLFIKERTRKGETRITTEAVQQSFSEIAKDLDFIKLVEDAYNPARPHSLRAAFNSRLIGKIDETLREFWMGHAIGTVAKAYLNMPTEEMRKLYMTAEDYLCIEKTSRQELDEREKGVPVVAEERIKELERLNADVWKFIRNDIMPTIDLFNEIADTSEGQILVKKINEERLQKEYEKEMIERG